jgi:hypothetical protein
MVDDLEQFVASLAIPADRKVVVLAELSDHVACAREAAVRDGRDPELAGRAALGHLEALRRSLEAVEPAFHVSRRHAMARGIVAALLIALLLDQGPAGLVGALIAVVLAGALAPPRALELLRAELRGPELRGTLGRSVAIGPALAYAYTVMSGPFVVWIGLIVVRAFRGTTDVDVPLSAFAVMAAVLMTLLVEGIRARWRRHDALA